VDDRKVRPEIEERESKKEIKRKEEERKGNERRVMKGTSFCKERKIL